jgi:hypothetical protein
MTDSTQPGSDEALLTILTTEHFVLQTARGGTIGEANGRAALYLGAPLRRRWAMRVARILLQPPTQLRVLLYPDTSRCDRLFYPDTAHGTAVAAGHAPAPSTDVPPRQDRPSPVLRPLAWWESPWLQLAAMVLFTVAFLAYLVLAIARRLRRSRGPVVSFSSAHWLAGSGLAAVSGFLGYLVLIGGSARLGGPDDLRLLASGAPRAPRSDCRNG